MKPNPSNSIQDLDASVLEIFPDFKLIDNKSFSLPAEEGLTIEDEEQSGYKSSGKDERPTIPYLIKARRGQTKFRNGLRKRYGDICMVTGCEILDIIEAAHINPYRGDNDNHISNGLLLRSDIHTLFDLNLIAIEPRTLIIHVHERAHSQYDIFHGKPLLGLNNGRKPSNGALRTRWKNFLPKK